MKADEYKQTAPLEDAFGGKRAVAELHCGIWEQVLATAPLAVERHVFEGGSRTIPGHEGRSRDGETIIETHLRLHLEAL